MTQMNLTFSQLPKLSDVVVHIVNNAGNGPGALSWAGNVVRLTELLYDFLQFHRDTSLETLLEWQGLRDALRASAGTAPTLAIESWMQHPMLEGMSVCVGPGGLFFDRIHLGIFPVLVARLEAAICAVKQEH
jgi:hypothetical protein